MIEMLRHMVGRITSKPGEKLEMSEVRFMNSVPVSVEVLVV